MRPQAALRDLGAASEGRGPRSVWPELGSGIRGSELDHSFLREDYHLRSWGDQAPKGPYRRFRLLVRYFCPSARRISETADETRKIVRSMERRRTFAQGLLLYDRGLKLDDRKFWRPARQGRARERTPPTPTYRLLRENAHGATEVAAAARDVTTGAAWAGAARRGPGERSRTSSSDGSPGRSIVSEVLAGAYSGEEIGRFRAENRRKAGE